MRIDINQKKIALGDKFKIFVDEQEKYAASSKLFRLLSVINLTKTDSTITILTIKKLWAWFKAKYTIELNDSTLEFNTISFWKRHYQCQVKNQFYDIYGHNGRKYSIYKNDKQIAWWSKKAVTWFDGDNYTITADNDSNIELLIIAFCLIIDNYTSKNRNNNSLNIDLGNIGRQTKKFDPDWQPKKQIPDEYNGTAYR